MSDINDTPDTENEAVETEMDVEVELGDPVEALVAENTELKDKLLRLAAEMENLRKRTEREIADTRAYAISGFARDMLVVTDNLSRALTAVPEEVRESSDDNVKSLIEGIEMTERENLSPAAKARRRTDCRRGREVRSALASGRFSRSPIRMCPKAPSFRSCRPVSPSAPASSGPRWSVSPRGGRRSPPRRRKRTRPKVRAAKWTSRPERLRVWPIMCRAGTPARHLCFLNA